MEKGDKVIAYTKTTLSSLKDNLNKNGREIGLFDILPIKGKVWGPANSNDKINIILDKEFEKYFNSWNLCFNKSDLIISEQFFKDEDFFI